MSQERAAGGAGHPLLTVLQDVIGCGPLSPTDDFYLVGGHSLLIVRVTKRLREQFGLHLDPRAFGVNSQLAALIAACISVGPAAAQQA
jgi:Phosphopantetheine attachment site